MTFELLISAVNRSPEELLKEMHLSSDAVLIIQKNPLKDTDDKGRKAKAGSTKEYELTFDGHRVKVVEQFAKGVGLSRNTALSRAEADIVLFADEDIVYEADYEEKVLSAFASHPEASVLLFNMRVDPRRKTYWNESPHRVCFTNYGRYPAYAIGIRREAVMNNNIRYSELFGGGARFSNGEDSLFLHDCLKKKLNLFAVTEVLGEETFRKSTWFDGYTDKYFYDRGVLYHFLYGKAALLLCMRFLFVHRDPVLKERSFINALGLMGRGIKKGKSL
ncbi:MAG: glycosyltransferase family 2 protein [Lachnospiraceae bacterium]|nr:glycosyltransferase family 2 protein [Lachnospiraceae bacterium]